MQKTEQPRFSPIAQLSTKGDRSSRLELTSKAVSSLGLINDDHRDLKKNRKIKCTRKYIILTVVTVLLLLAIILTATLVPILIQSTNKTESVSVPLRWNPSGITLAGIPGSAGSAAYQLSLPNNLVLDSSNAVYTTETYKNRIQKFPVGASNGSLVAGQANGLSGTGLDRLAIPSGVDVDAQENIYISDKSNSRVMFWRKGALQGSIVAGVNGTPGTGNNQLLDPLGVDLDLISSRLFIADSGNHRVMSYSLGATSGTIVAGGFGSGSSTNQLSNPVSVHYDSYSNSLFIANAGRHNVLRWGLGENHWISTAGNVNGSLGSTDSSLNDPRDAILDPMGNVYVADRWNHRIQLFLAGQSLGQTIAGVTAILGNSSTLLNGPTSIALDTQLNLYVADRFNHRVQKFLRY